jgi:hypothetical protein
MMGLTYEIIQTNARASWRTHAQQRGALVAQSVLARVGADIALVPGSVDGVADDMSWRVEIDRYRGEGSNDRGNGGLLEVVVSVRSAGDRKALLDVRTLRLAS